MSPSDFQAYAQTPSQQATHQPAPIPTATKASHLNKFLTNMLRVAWYNEFPPPNTHEQPNSLYFLYTISGIVLIGPWPQHNGFPQEMNEHYCGWAYLTQDQLPLIRECLQ